MENKIRRIGQPRSQSLTFRHGESRQSLRQHLREDRTVQDPHRNLQNRPHLHPAEVSRRLRQRHHPEHSRGHGQRRPGDPQRLVLRGSVQHTGHSDQAVQTVGVPSRFKDPRHRADRVSDGQDDGPGPGSSHNIPVAADHVRAGREEQRHRGRPG